MNGGDTNLGGSQVTPGSSTPPTSGSQPAASVDSGSKDSSPIISVPHADKVPSRPLVIKVQTPTPQPSTPAATATSDISLHPQPIDTPDLSDTSIPTSSATPSTTPSQPADISTSPTPPVPASNTPESPTATPAPAVPAPLPPSPPPDRSATTPTEAFSSPTPAATGAYYGTTTNTSAQSYPGGYTNPTASPIMQAYTSQYPTSTDTYAQDDQEFIELAGSTPQPKKSKKWIIIGVVAVVLVGTATLFAVLFSINSSSESQNSAQFSTKKEVYNALWDFNNKYYISLIEGYDFSIGLIPDFKMSSSDILFPAELYANILSQGVNDAESTYNNILPTLPNKIASDNIDLSQVKTSIGESLQALKQNSDLISEFYDTYIAPLISDSRPRTCSKTSAMTTLEQGRTANAASKYYTVYCDALNFINTTSDALVEPAVLDLQQQVATPASDAATALNDLLVDVPSATDSINQLFKELTK